SSAPLSPCSGWPAKWSYTSRLSSGTGLGPLFGFWPYRRWVWVAPATTIETVAGGRQPMPATSAAAVHPGPQHVPSTNGDGHAPGLLHANGQRGADPSARTGSFSRDGWGR